MANSVRLSGHTQLIHVRNDRIGVWIVESLRLARGRRRELSGRAPRP